MADATADLEEGPKKKSKLPMIIGLVLALAGGGGGYFAVASGLILGGGEEAAMAEKADPPGSDVAFVPIEPLTVSLGRESANRHLRFHAQLEVSGGFEAEVGAVMPRIVDVMNSYLRAIDVRELEDPATLLRLRAQLLRRIQIITGEDRVKDLLIMEFVLN